MRSVLILVLLSLMGCKDSPVICPGFRQVQGYNLVWYKIPITIGFDSSVEPSHKDAMIKAIDEWNRSTGMTLFFLKTGPVQVLILESDTWTRSHNEQGYTTIWTVHNHITQSMIWINTMDFSHNGTVGSIDLKSLMIHELGHTLGLQHQSETVMNPYLGRDEKRDQIDKESIDRIKCGYAVK